jgi:uncharacterized protein YjcR
MSKMADLSYDIEQLYIEGYSPKTIALMLECPAIMIYNWLDENNIRDDSEVFNPHDTVNS